MFQCLDRNITKRSRHLVWPWPVIHMIMLHKGAKANLVGLLDECRLAVRIAQLLPDGNEHHFAHGTVEVVLLDKAVVDLGSCCCGPAEGRVCTQLLRRNRLKVHHADGDELGCELATDILDLIGELWADILEDRPDNLVLSVDVR